MFLSAARSVGLLVVMLLVVSCGANTVADTSSDPADGDGLFPDVVDATATTSDDGTFDFSVTVSSPYDTPQRYADAWRIRNTDGTVYGVRELLHDHAAEQPFTRSLGGVVIPDEVASVVVEGRDQVNGWGGATLELDLP